MSTSAAEKVLADLPDLILLPELAARLRTSPNNLRRMVANGDGPPAMRLGKRRIAFAASGVREWFASRAI